MNLRSAPPAAGSPGTADIVRNDSQHALRLQGDWTLPHHRALNACIAELRKRAGETNTIRTIDASGLAALDTAGADLLCSLLGPERTARLAESFSPERRALLQTVAAARERHGEAPAAASTSGLGDILAHIGGASIAFFQHLRGVFGLIGVTLETLLRISLQPRRWRLTSFFAHLEQSGLDAVPIVALLTFLVGAVVAFLGATVLTDFGASVYTIDLVAYAFLREFGVLLAAILVAGRTASAFAAQIGSMRAGQEVDAIRVLGLSPVELLVLPRVLALLVALPILSFLSMAAGLAGGMLVCAVKLDISPSMFISTIETNVALRHFIIGIAKAPIFAFLIALIGCHEGFKASGSARSVGEHTTSAVVQSLFAVILVDAIAALFCMEMGW